MEGHLRIWQLDPRPGNDEGGRTARTLAAPLVVTVGYFPPVNTDRARNTGSQWCSREMRQTLLRCLDRAGSTMRELSRSCDAFPLAFVHHNAPNGGCPVALIDLPGGPDIDGVVGRISQPERFRHRQAKLSQQPDGSLLVERLSTLASLKAYSPARRLEGEHLIRRMAHVGLVPVNGTLSVLQPTSFTPCGACTKNKHKLQCDCQKPRLRGPLEDIFVPANLLYQALTDANGGRNLLHLSIRTIFWSKGIDHRVSLGHALVRSPPSLASCAVPPQLPPKVKPRYKRPLDLHQAKLVGQAAAAAADDVVEALMAALQSENAGVGLIQPLSIEEANTALVEGLARARSTAESLAKEAKDTEEANMKPALQHTRRLARELRQAHSRVTRAIRTKKRLQAKGAFDCLDSSNGARGLSAEEVLLEANRAKRRAEVVLARACKAMGNAELLRQLVHAPKSFWMKMGATAEEKGAPPPPRFKLLQRLNDKHRKLVSTNPKRIIEHLIRDRREVYSTRPNLGEPFENRLAEAAAAVHVHNADLLGKARSLAQAEGRDDDVEQMGRSAVAASACYPERPLERVHGGDDAEERRALLRQKLHAHVQHIRQGRADATVSDVAKRYPQAYRQLQAPITEAEVASALDKIKDVGCGTDDCAPVLLGNHRHCNALADEVSRRGPPDVTPGRTHPQGLDPGVEQESPSSARDRCATVKLACQLFNRVWTTMCMPSSWDEHRLLFLFKGKNGDPHCPDSYRGLGIDQTNLKWLSLVMLERLEVFLTRTHALSVQQGGFQRLRGTPEQVLTLSETVRAAARRGNVHLAFIDLQKAYDSVDHTLLWHKCMKIGVDGNYLAVVQAIYHHAMGMLEIDGRRLQGVPIECGVLQGNPLSPALFNIFIDEAVRGLVDQVRREAAETPGLQLGHIGLPLPRVKQHGTVDTLRGLSELEQDDFLPSLFFADDGVLMEMRRDVMQLMLTAFDTLILRDGLLMNTCKTYHMLVGALGIDERMYRAAVARTIALRVAGAAITMVDQFEYLGVMLNWRWNWDLAWEAACTRATAVLHAHRRAGWQHRAGSMHALLTVVRSKIFSHFAYIAAVTGAGGATSSAAWRRSMAVMTDALQAISGVRFAPASALPVEAGVWDQETWIDMLLLRFWCKVSAAPILSTTYRAACLSVRSLYHNNRRDPIRADSDKNRVHCQHWAQQLAAAAARFGLDVGTILSLRPTPLVRLTLVDVDAGTTTPLPYPSDDTKRFVPLRITLSEPGKLLRWVLSKDVPAVIAHDGDAGSEVDAEGRLVEGRSCWTLPHGTEYASAFDLWTPQLHDACYMALKRLGNHVRQVKVRSMVAATGADSGGRRWATVVSASFLRAYWFLPNVEDARRLLRLRLDMGPYEDYVRRRPYRSSDRHPSLPRLERHARVCYLCGDDASTYALDTREHMLLHCAHPAMRAFREESRTHLRDLVRESSGLLSGTTLPDLDNETTFLWLLLLADNTGNPPTSTTGDRILDMQADWDHARTAARWISTVVGAWTNYMRVQHRPNPLAELGRRVTTYVATRATRVCLLHYQLTKNNPEYRARTRTANKEDHG